MRWVKLHPHNIAQKVADHRRALPRQRRAACSTGSQGDGRHRSPQGGGALQARDRQVHRRRRATRRRHPGRVLRRGHRRRVRRRTTFTETIDEPRPEGPRPARRVRHRRVPGAARGQQVPDRLRPAAAVRHVRRQAALRASPPCRPCPGSTAPTRPSGGKDTDLRRWTSSTSPTRSWQPFKPYFTEALPGDRHRPEHRPRPAAKLDQPRIYTEAEVDGAVEALVTEGKGNNALTGCARPRQAALPGAVHRRRCDGSDDKAALDELDLFRKDVGTFVRLYDFMSQIIDYGDTELEKQSIYLRLLRAVIQPDNYTAPLDLSDVVLVAVKQIDKGKSDIGLGKPGRPGRRDRRRIRRQEGPEDGRLRTPSSTGSTTCSAARTSPTARRCPSSKPCCGPCSQMTSLVQQAQVNTPKQFTESPDFDDAVVGAVADNQGAHNKMADYFFGEGQSPARADRHDRLAGAPSRSGSAGGIAARTA